MTDAVATPNVAIPKVGKTVAVALMMGLSIQLVGTLAWVALIRLTCASIQTRLGPRRPWRVCWCSCSCGSVAAVGHAAHRRFDDFTCAYGSRNPAHGLATAWPRSSA